MRWERGLALMIGLTSKAAQPIYWRVFGGDWHINLKSMEADERVLTIDCCQELDHLLKRSDTHISPGLSVSGHLARVYLLKAPLSWVNRHSQHTHSLPCGPPTGHTVVCIVLWAIQHQTVRCGAIIIQIWQWMEYKTRTTRTSALWGYPPTPQYYPYYWFILDPKSKQDVKFTNLKNLFEFWIKGQHTFWSCLIRFVNMKWIQQVLLNIQSGHDSVHRRTDRQTDKVKPVYPLSTLLKRGYNENTVFRKTRGINYFYENYSHKFSVLQLTSLTIVINAMVKFHLFRPS